MTLDARLPLNAILMKVQAEEEQEVRREHDRITTTAVVLGVVFASYLVQKVFTP